MKPEERRKREQYKEKNRLDNKKRKTKVLQRRSMRAQERLA